MVLVILHKSFACMFHNVKYMFTSTVPIPGNQGRFANRPYAWNLLRANTRFAPTSGDNRNRGWGHRPRPYERHIAGHGLECQISRPGPGAAPDMS